MPPPCRRWFQFGLRTMFAVVAVCAVTCGWVGRQLQWANERHRFFLYETRERTGEIVFSYGTPGPLPWQLEVVSLGQRLQIDGCEPYRAIDVWAERSETDRSCAKALFPEAEIKSHPNRYF